jgi:hypothetical protein
MTRLKLTLDLEVPSGVEVTRLIAVLTDAADDLGCEVRPKVDMERVPDLHLVKSYGGSDPE